MGTNNTQNNFVALSNISFVINELQKAEIVDTSKFVPSVFIETHYCINNG